MTESSGIISLQHRSVDSSLWEITVLISQADGLTKALQIMVGDLPEDHASWSVTDSLSEKMKALESEHQRLCDLMRNQRIVQSRHSSPA